MSQQKKNKGTPISLRKEKLRIADHYNSLVKSYVGDEAQRKTIMQAFLAKKPKSYAQINYKLYRFNTIILSVLHLISFLGAVSIIGYIQTLPIGATAHLLSIMAVLFLIISEFGQHSMLNTAFENWHATNNVPTRIGLMCVFFSVVSIASSCFGTYHFAQTYNFPSNTIVMAMLTLSGVVEVLILYTTLELHNYQKVVYQESVLVNDMYFQNEHSLFFDGIPNVQKMGTVLIDDNAPTLPQQVAPEQAPKQAQQPEIIIQDFEDEYTRPKRKKTVKSVSNSTGIAIRKTAPKQPKTAPKTISTDTEEKAQQPVITASKPKTTAKNTKKTVKPKTAQKTASKQKRKHWNKTDTRTNRNTYRKRIQERKKAGEEPTPEQQTGYVFFQTILDTFDFTKGNFPYVEVEDRKDYFKNAQNSKK